MKKLNYLKIKNLTDTKAEISIYGDIVGDEWEKWCDTDVCPQDVIDALDCVKNKDLDIYINSCGGSVFAGIAIYNMLKRHNGKKTVYIDSIAGSIASVIAMVGDEINMHKNSFLVIHKPSSYVCGNADDFRKLADELDIIQGSLQETYKTRLKSEDDLNTIIDMINAETWLNAEEASKYFNINVLEENKAVAFVKTSTAYKNIPKSAKNLFEKEDVSADEEDNNKIHNDQTRNKLYLELELLSM